MPQKLPQKAAVASGVGSVMPAARPTAEEAVTAPTPCATRLQVSAAAIEEQPIRAPVFFRNVAGEVPPAVALGPGARDRTAAAGRSEQEECDVASNAGPGARDRSAAAGTSEQEEGDVASNAGPGARDRSAAAGTSEQEEDDVASSAVAPSRHSRMTSTLMISAGPRIE